MKPDERALVDQEENNPGDPSHEIAQHCGYIFGHPRLRALRRLCHCSPRLRLTALGTKSRARRHFTATLAAKGHWVSPLAISPREERKIVARRLSSPLAPHKPFSVYLSIKK
jgi:hypothetical protein